MATSSRARIPKRRWWRGGDDGPGPKPDVGAAAFRTPPLRPSGALPRGRPRPETRPKTPWRKRLQAACLQAPLRRLPEQLKDPGTNKTASLEFLILRLMTAVAAAGCFYRRRRAIIPIGREKPRIDPNRNKKIGQRRDHCNPQTHGKPAPAARLTPHGGFYIPTQHRRPAPNPRNGTDPARPILLSNPDHRMKDTA